MSDLEESDIDPDTDAEIEVDDDDDETNKKLKIAAHGLVEDDEVNEIRESSLHEINLNFAELGSFDILNEPKMAEAVRIIIRRKFRERTGKRPITSVHIV